MPLPLIDIEHRITLLRGIDVATLDLEARVEYHVAMIEALKARLKHLLFYFNYKTALVVEAEIKDEEKALALCYELLSPTQLKKLEICLPKANRFRAMVDQGKVTPAMSLEDIERNIRTILFGIPFDLTFDGKGYIITKTYKDLNIEPELIKLEEFCKARDFKLLDNEKRTKRKKEEFDKPLYLEVIKDS